MDAPAPWSLTGQGFILFFRFSRAALDAEAPVRDPMRGRWLGGVGALMIVDYATSDVGPYREILLVPGRAMTADGPFPSVAQIAVSSQDSVENGRRNWAIPKTLARFVMRTSGDATQVTVDDLKGPMFSATLTPWAAELPVNTRWVPDGWRTLHQPCGDGALRTRVMAHGRGSLCSVQQLKLPHDRWPWLKGAKLLGAVAARQFEMTFPVPVDVGSVPRRASRLGEHLDAPVV